MSAVDDYLDAVEQPFRVELEKLRKLIREVVPGAEESMSYGLPAFKYKNKPLIYFGAFKDHMSIFPNPKPLEEFKDRLKDYVVSKGTVQFSVEHPLPRSLIEDMLHNSVTEIDANQ